jgi:hypothetical protein
MVKGEQKEETENVRYFISSLALSPKQTPEIVIKHWTAETVRQRPDVACEEDKCRIYRGSSAEPLSAPRKMGLNIISPIVHLYGNESTRRIMKLLSRDMTFLLTLINRNPKDIGPPWLWRKAMGEFAPEYPEPPNPCGLAA